MSAVSASRATLSSGLPSILPIFPLAGVVLLPQARLPLNIFEPRYLAMVDHALGSGRLIGMIQPAATQILPSSQPPIYNVGCAGRITSFTETDDGRCLIALTGLCRFTVVEELAQDHQWRRVRPDWNVYLDDLKPIREATAPLIDRARLMRALTPYFREEGITLDKNVADNAPDDVLVSSLVMMCPLPSSEKQALLEAKDIGARAQLLTALLEMACMPVPGEADGGAGVRH